MYPNPVTGNLAINLSRPTYSARVSLYQINGKMVLKTTITTKTAEIDLSQLAPVLYFIEIASGDTFVTKKIIKQ